MSQTEYPAVEALRAAVNKAHAAAAQLDDFEALKSEVPALEERIARAATDEEAMKHSKKLADLRAEVAVKELRQPQKEEAARMLWEDAKALVPAAQTAARSITGALHDRARAAIVTVVQGCVVPPNGHVFHDSAPDALPGPILKQGRILSTLETSFNYALAYSPIPEAEGVLQKIDAALAGIPAATAEVERLEAAAKILAV